MNRWVLPVAWIVASVALAQESMRSRLRSIEAPIRLRRRLPRRNGDVDARRFPRIRRRTVRHLQQHLRTGVLGVPDSDGARPLSDSSIAAACSLSGPSTPSVFYPTGYDEAPGCSTSALVDGFEIASCSSATHSFDYRLEFANSYTACGAAPMVADAIFDLTALPGGTSSGAQRCWTLDVDLQGSGQSFVLSADGDGSYTGPSTSEQFGAAWTMIDPTIAIADYTGPIVAGDFTWTGGPGTVSGPLALQAPTGRSGRPPSISTCPGRAWPRATSSASTRNRHPRAATSSEGITTST
jgi:hypothetical protein